MKMQSQVRKRTQALRNSGRCVSCAASRRGWPTCGLSCPVVFPRWI